jgi:hypothetical protein
MAIASTSHPSGLIASLSPETNLGLMTANKQTSKLFYERYYSDTSRRQDPAQYSFSEPKRKPRKRSNDLPPKSAPRNGGTRPEDTVKHSAAKNYRRSPKSPHLRRHSTKYDPTATTLPALENLFFKISPLQKVTDEEAYQNFKAALLTQRAEREMWRKRRHRNKKIARMNSQGLVKACNF